MEGPRTSHRGSREATRSQEALLEVPEVPRWPPKGLANHPKLNPIDPQMTPRSPKMTLDLSRQLSSAQLNSAQLRSAQLSSTPLSSAHLGSAQLCCTSTQLNSAQRHHRQASQACTRYTLKCFCFISCSGTSCSLFFTKAADLKHRKTNSFSQENTHVNKWTCRANLRHGQSRPIHVTWPVQAYPTYPIFAVKKDQTNPIQSGQTNPRTRSQEKKPSADNRLFKCFAHLQKTTMIFSREF